MQYLLCLLQTNHILQGLCGTSGRHEHVLHWRTHITLRTPLGRPLYRAAFLGWLGKSLFGGTNVTWFSFLNYHSVITCIIIFTYRINIYHELYTVLDNGKIWHWLEYIIRPSLWVRWKSWGRESIRDFWKLMISSRFSRGLKL